MTSVVENLRKFRLDGMAVFDFAATFLVGEFIKWSFNLSTPRSVLYSILVLLGISIHALTNQQTELNKKLFNRYEFVYLAILIVVIVYISRFYLVSSTGKF